jgi:ribosomal protein L10
MSKYVKDLLTKDISQRLEGVEEALLVDVIGMSANESVALRRQLRDKNIGLMVVKNSLARRATSGSPLNTAFEGSRGSIALVWGGEDFVSLTKEVSQFDKDIKNFETRGGVMDGELLTADKVKEISKWPNREEQLSILSGQILSAGGQLLSQINAPGGLLVSQLDKKAEEEEEEEEGEAAAE